MKDILKENQGAALSRLLTKEHLKQSGLASAQQVSSGPVTEQVRAVIRSSTHTRSAKGAGLSQKAVKKLAGSEK